MGIPRRQLLWLPAALAAALTAWAVLTRPADVRLSDLGVYTGAVDGLRHSASLYDFMSAGHAPFTFPRSPACCSCPSPTCPRSPSRRSGHWPRSPPSR